jgi:hypothetical protein
MVKEYRERAKRALEHISCARLVSSEQEMKLNVSLGVAIFNTKGAVPEIATTYKRALEIADGLGSTPYQLRALWGLARERYVSGDYQEALIYCERYGQVALGSGDRAAALVYDRMMALGLHIVGRHAEARPYAERALNHPAATIRTAHKSFNEYDNRVASRSHLARILWVQGFADRAVAIAQEGVAHGVSLDYPPALCYVLAYAACPIAFWTGNLPAARRYVKLLLEQSANLSLNYWEAWRQCYEQVMLLGEDDGSVAFENRLLSLKASVVSPIYVDMLGTLREGLAGPEAIARAESGRAGWATPEILRDKAVSILKQGVPNAAPAAEAVLIGSLEIARQQGAHSWELRTATTLARLWQQQRRVAEARDLLKPVYDWFDEGFTTTDLLAARQFLDDLTA